MGSVNMSTIGGIIVAVIAILAAIYLIDPTFFGLFRSRVVMMPSGSEGFADMEMADSNDSEEPGSFEKPKEDEENTKNAEHVAESGSASEEGFADVGAYDAAASFGSAAAPAGCYARDQLTPAELLPKDQNSIWAQQNPMGTGSLKGKNFLSAGALIGVNTVGQSLRNSNLQLRSEPANPQVAISIFNQSTIEPDINRRPLEIA
jgi:hypothetical protein